MTNEQIVANTTAQHQVEEYKGWALSWMTTRPNETSAKALSTEAQTKARKMGVALEDKYACTVTELKGELDEIMA